MDRLFSWKMEKSRWLDEDTRGFDAKWGRVKVYDSSPDLDL